MVLSHGSGGGDFASGSTRFHITHSLIKIEKNQISRYLTVQSRIEILIGFALRGISRYKFKLRFLFNLNLQLTKVSLPFRISICISFTISSLIFQGTGCIAHSLVSAIKCVVFWIMSLKLTVGIIRVRKWVHENWGQLLTNFCDRKFVALSHGSRWGEFTNGSQYASYSPNRNIHVTHPLFSATRCLVWSHGRDMRVRMWVQKNSNHSLTELCD